MVKNDIYARAVGYFPSPLSNVMLPINASMICTQLQSLITLGLTASSCKHYCPNPFGKLDSSH
ncbi:MAG: hypothetical protein CM15mP25_0190 [Gammaproteobacteria bacterium]|nr:MAG: hypothetical protein CM15mP25_0190 [Gammaproteobacteria bacterium]